MNNKNPLDLQNYNLNELKDLKGQIDSEIRSREAQEQNHVICKFSAESFDRRKHGHAYVAIIKRDESNKIQREFLNNVNRVYNNRGTLYDADWTISLPVGTKIEARLDDGSWKNDYRSYFVVEQDGLRNADKDEVMK